MSLLTWIFFAVLLFIFFVYLDFALGRRSHIKNLAKKRFPSRKSDVLVYTSGPQLFQNLFKDVDKAKHHVHLLFYIVRNDDFGSEFVDLLMKKVQEGVKVRLLLDWIGSFRFSRKTIKLLQKKGVHVAFCHTPRFPFFLYKLQSRNHRKITVIDGEIGYLGGFNVGREYINEDDVLSPWRDCHVRFVGEGVKDLQDQFLIDWLEATGKDLTALVDYYPPLYAGRVDHRFYASEGVELEDTYCRLLRQAKKEIFIGTPYFVPGKKVFHELLTALKRGVKLTIIVPKKQDHIFVQEASFRYFRKLVKNGAVVFQYENGFYHAKLIIIDDFVCSIGTANFDMRSLYLNHEMNSFFRDQKFIEQMKAIVAKDISKSVQMPEKLLFGFHPWRKLKELIAIIISPLL
ncbi:cardiolipin synthase [Bacillus kwashiorkori]|uniref:cardiolipin synthase n=1 Tax=Bacillus kwashiorkori TaxID=1522318 RepID=UPI0008F86561|nr:cardiolipin synthase [Bacillus kwashiorkori]